MKELLLDDRWAPVDGAPAWLVERTGPTVPTHEEFTLAQVRENF